MLKPSERADMERKVWLTYKCNQECNQKTMLVSVNFSSQKKIPISRLLSEIGVLYIYFWVQKCLSFHRCIPNALTYTSFLAFLFLSHFQLSLLNEVRMPCHSLICQSRSTFTYMEHVRSQWKPIHNPKRVFLRGVGEMWLKLWLTHRLPCSEQWPKPHAHNYIIK